MYDNSLLLHNDCGDLDSLISILKYICLLIEMYLQFKSFDTIIFSLFFSEQKCLTFATQKDVEKRTPKEVL